MIIFKTVLQLTKYVSAFPINLEGSPQEKQKHLFFVPTERKQATPGFVICFWARWLIQGDNWCHKRQLQGQVQGRILNSHTPFKAGKLQTLGEISSCLVLIVKFNGCWWHIFHSGLRTRSSLCYASNTWARCCFRENLENLSFSV